MGALLAALPPQKNLAYAVAGAFLVVLIETLAKKYIGVSIAQEIAGLLSTPAAPVTSGTVLATEASSVAYVIAHGSDIIDQLKGKDISPVAVVAETTNPVKP